MAVVACVLITGGVIASQAVPPETLEVEVALRNGSTGLELCPLLVNGASASIRAQDLQLTDGVVGLDILDSGCSTSEQTGVRIWVNRSDLVVLERDK